MEFIRIRVQMNGEKTALTSLTQIDSKINEINKKKVNVNVNTKATDELASSAKNAATQSRLLGDTLSMIKFTAIAAAIGGVTMAFKSALTEMKAVDTQLTNIQKVSGMTAAELDKIGDKAYATASKYGVAANEYLSAVYTFQKAGLGDAADQLGELATKTMLVGDTSAEVASKFLIAVNAAWEMGGSMEKLSTVVDQADYINNNYATSLDKLAAAMPIVASTSANLGMSIEETMAVIGTITAKTQETGTKAATAWRALAMNITGELGSIVDETGETIEVTEESVKSISDALKIYGNDAVKAAQQTGQIIDPMQGVISLAEAYKDGLLTDIELEKILMSVGGKLRTNQLTALVKDLASETSTYYDIMSKLPDAAGTADSEINIMLSSWESKTKILSNTWTEFVQKSVTSEGIKGFIDGLTNLIDFMDNAGTAAIGLGGILTAVFGAKIATGIGNALVKTYDFVEALGAAKTAAISLQGAFGIVGIAIAALTAGYMALKESQERTIDNANAMYEESLKNADSYQSELDSIESLTEKYADLAKSGGSLAEIQSIQDQINKLLEDQNVAVDLVNGSYEEQVGILNTATETLRKMKQDQLDIARTNAEIALITSTQNVFGKEKKSGTYAGGIDENIFSGLSGFNVSRDEWGVNGVEMQWASSPDEIVRQYDEITEAISRMAQAYSSADLSDGRSGVGKVWNWLNDQKSGIADAAEQYKAFLKLGEESSAADDTAANLAENLVEVAEAANTATNNIENVTEAMQRLKDVASEDTGFRSMSDAVAKFREMIDAGEVNSRAFWNTAEFLFGPEVLDEYYGNAQGLIALFENSNLEEVFDGESLDGFIESLREVDDAIAQVSETEDGTTSFVINDVDALAEAWGMTKTQVLSLIEAAEAFGELDFTGNGLIDYLDYLGVAFENGKTTAEDVTAALSDLGYTTQYIEGVVTALENMGAIDMSGTQSEAEATAESADNVAGAADAASTSTQNLNNQTLGNVTGQFDGLSTAATNAATNVNNTSMQNVIGEMGRLQGAISTANDKALWFKDTLMSIDGTSVTTTITTNNVQTFTTIGTKFAKGTQNAPGGAALVGDEYSPSGKPKPELIVDNGTAWIGGMNGPEIVRLSPGAQVYTYDQTRRMMQGTAFTTAMPAFAMGNVNVAVADSGSGNSSYSAQTCKITFSANGGSGAPGNMTVKKNTSFILPSKKPTRSGYTFQGWARGSVGGNQIYQPGGKCTVSASTTFYAKWKKNASGAGGSVSSSSSTSSNSSTSYSTSGGGGGGGSSGGGSSGSSGSSSSSSTTSTRDKMMKDIEATLEDKEFAIWLGLKNGTMTAEEAAKAYRELMDYVSSKSKEYALMGDTEKSSYIQKLQKQWFEYYDELTDMQGDLMSELKESLNRQLSAAKQVDALEEKRLALIEAQEALTNAQNERTVRIYNAATGQWEWVADAKAVQTAQENLKNAQDALADEEIRQAINAVTSSMEEPGRPIESILADINAIGTDRQKEAASGAAAASAAIEEMYGVSDLGEEANKAITQIGSTFFITQKPAKISGAASALTRQLTGNTMGSGSKLADAAQANADRRTQYFIDGVEISDSRAKSMTLADLAQSLSSLAVYNNT